MAYKDPYIVPLLLVMMPFTLGCFSPKKSLKTKHCNKVKGGYSPRSFKNYILPTSIVSALVSASNQSLAMTTWSSYKTVETHLKHCELDTQVQIRFPMDDREMMYNS